MLLSGDILVVDDEINIVDLVVEVLREEGYSVRTAHDGASALAAVVNQPPALILLDLSMPGMAGTALIQELRNRGIDGIPVVIMTASQHASRALVVHGADGYLAKPFDLDELINCVGQFVAPPNDPDR